MDDVGTFKMYVKRIERQKTTFVIKSVVDKIHSCWTVIYC